MEKNKKIRQSFSNAVTDGRRSGSGKIALKLYDTLICSLVQPQLSHSSLAWKVPAALYPQT